MGVLISLGRRSVRGEIVSELVAMVDRVVLAESWAIEGFTASLGGDSSTSVDWGLVELMVALTDKTG